jgi:hypothetical protein
MSRRGRDTTPGKPPETKQIRCAIYTRKSSEEGLDQDFNSLDAQRESAESFIASQRAEGWVCVPTRYDDGGFTGGNMDRPALQRLLADIDAGLVNCVVVYKVDRLSRSLIDFARMMEVFEKHGISFVSVTQQFNTTHSVSIEGAMSLLDAPIVVLDGADPLNWSAGTIVIRDAGTFVLTSGTLTIGDQTDASPFLPDNPVATLDLGVGAEASAAGGVEVILDGSIVGSGKVVDDVQCSGSIQARTALAFGRDLTLEADSIVRVQLRADGADAVHVTGALALGGSLDVTLENGFKPMPGGSFDVLSASEVMSAFGHVGLPFVTSGSLHVQYLRDRVRIVYDAPGMAPR